MSRTVRPNTSRPVRKLAIPSNETVAAGTSRRPDSRGTTITSKTSAICALPSWRMARCAAMRLVPCTVSSTSSPSDGTITTSTSSALIIGWEKLRRRRGPSPSCHIQVVVSVTGWPTHARSTADSTSSRYSSIDGGVKTVTASGCVDRRWPSTVTAIDGTSSRPAREAITS